MLFVACGTPGPYSAREIQLPLGGDRKCSDPVLGQTAMQCCTGWEGYAGHDNCYWAGGTEQDRFACDAEFLACMAIWGVPEEIAEPRYRVLRKLGGGSFNYREHRTRGPAK